MTQGQGSQTEQKERGIGVASAVSLRLSNASQCRHFPFWHVDLNSGCGINAQVGCDGSPLVFFANVDKSPRPFHAFFVDKVEGAILELSERLKHRPTAYCFHADNSEILPVVKRMMEQHRENPRYVFGSVIVDPNGYDTDWPIDKLRDFAHEHPRMDIILNLSLRSFSLQNGHKVQGSKGWANRRLIRPSEWPSFLGRQHGVVREPSPGGHRFLLMCLRSMPAGASRPMGMWDIHSSKGREVFQNADNKPGLAPNATPQLPGLFEAPCFSSCAQPGVGA